jgi:hypothetical protein
MANPPFDWQEQLMDSRGLFALAVAAALFSTSAVQAQSTKRPQPPPQVCIGADCVASPTAPSGDALKFHPGFYPYFNYAGGTNMSKFNRDVQLINSLKPNDNVAGIAIAIMWRTIDTGTTGPNYDWSVIDAYLKALKGVNKRLWVRVQDAYYGNNASTANGRAVVPDWLIKKYGAQNVQVDYTHQPAPRGIAAKRYSAAVTNAYIAMFQAMAQRYDSDPSFEGVTLFEETAYAIDTSGGSVTLATPGADYSEKGMFDQLYALMAGVRDGTKGFKTSNVMVAGNYLFIRSDSAANWTAVFTQIQKYRMVLGGADSFIASWVYPSLPNASAAQVSGPGTSNHSNPEYRRSIFSDEVYRGWWKGSSDWRGKILFGPDVEITDIGGYITKNMNPIPTLADIWEVRGPKLDRSHYFFFDINWAPSGNYGTPAQQWSTAQYPWVKSAGSTNTTNPYQ